jgi:hypothetical protein
LTPLCVICNIGNDQVATALLDAGANINQVRTTGCAGFTPLMLAIIGGHASLAKLLLERGADGTKMTTEDSASYVADMPVVVAGSTALDIARTLASDSPHADFAEILAVLRLSCCSSCGITSSGLSKKAAATAAATAAGAAGVGAAAAAAAAAAVVGATPRLKSCSRCPASGPRARYCGTPCQLADWVARHRTECTEARRARQAAGVD